MKWMEVECVEGGWEIEKGNERRKDGRDTLICPV